MPLSLRHLDLFRLLMQVRNVTETARLQRVSQPAVSLALKALEAELGIKLFLRRGGHIIPTVESHALLREVERLFQQLGAVENRAMELRDANAGHLAVGSIPTLAGSVLPRAVALYRAERPRVRLTMNGHDKAELTRLIRLEELDMALAYSPVDDATVAVDPIMRTAMLCLLPRQHVLANKKTINLSQLLGQNLIMHPSTPPSIVLHERSTTLGTRLEATVEANLSLGAVALVRQGVGIFVTEPIILLSGIADDLEARPFEPETPLVLTSIYTRRRPVPRLLTPFMAKLRQALNEARSDLRRRGFEMTLL
jgi:DNA-binding transcriptional LysR family regulator